MSSLSKRLDAVLHMIPKGSIVADIGSDHALLPCALIKHGICEKVYACDVAKGPLAHAQANIAVHGYEKQIKTQLCDGLDGVDHDANTIVIAGMGFDTMLHILNDDPDQLKSREYLILQTNTGVEEIRHWVNEHRYKIEDETIVFEGHYYIVMRVHLIHDRELKDDEITFGISLYKHPLFCDYWTYRKRILDDILIQMNPTHPKYEVFEKERNYIIKHVKTYGYEI